MKQVEATAEVKAPRHALCAMRAEDYAIYERAPRALRSFPSAEDMRRAANGEVLPELGSALPEFR